jgi:hypothetical protein
MRRIIIINSILLLISAWVFADAGMNDLTGIDQPDAWKQLFLARLTERLSDTFIPRDTLLLVLHEVSSGVLPSNPRIAAEKVFHWAKKYDSKLRKGYTYSQVVLELKKDIYLSRNENNANNIFITIYADDSYDKIKIKDKKDKDLKDKIKKDKDKDK